MHNYNSIKRLRIKASVLVLVLTMPLALSLLHMVVHHHHVEVFNAGLQNQHVDCLISDFDFALFVTPPKVCIASTIDRVINYFVPICFEYRSNELSFSGLPRSPPLA